MTTRQDLIEGAARQMAEVRIELDRIDGLLDRAWRHYEQAQANQREIGLQTDLLLSRQLEAAYGAWRLNGPHETRVELARITEAPVE